jgi:Fe2+ transport system protein B
METISSEARERNLNGKDHEVKVVHHADRVNLYDYGYEKSGSVKGDPDVYASYLNRIINGDLVEEPYKGFTDEEKKDRLKQMKNLEKQVKEREEANVKIDTEIKEKEKNVEKYRKDLLQIRETRAKDKEKMKGENFSVVKFSLNLFILSMLSIYLLFFNVSAKKKDF